MRGFNFEKNLEHQTQAVKSTIQAFEGLQLDLPAGVDQPYLNPLLRRELPTYKFVRNIIAAQQENGIGDYYQEQKTRSKFSNVLDIMMETGTGKTYTYTKTIFELNRNYGIFKFVVVVPTLSIKAGTINFLKSEGARTHFKEQYGKTIKLHIVESQKSSRNKKSFFPAAVNSFVKSAAFEQSSIQVMIINSGMLTSETLQKSFDRSLFDKYTVPFEAIAATRPFVIIDEPHKFAKSNKSWKAMLQMQPQFILRYGATFQQYDNLVYTLSAVDAFNKNLVKGVIGHITEFEDGKNASVRFVSSDGKLASMELAEKVGGKMQKKTIKVAEKEGLQKVHPAMTDLWIEKLNKTKLLLSNGLEMTKKAEINPYSYAQQLQELMVQKAVKKHFELERQLLNRAVKIKPLTLFFIDNIEEYRNEDGALRKLLEISIKAEVNALLKVEKVGFYRSYLEKTLKDLSKTHAGYFSKDNTGNDEAVEQEVNEILHDKETMLDLENPRRFIFSKWTLREGWDNPNVFQICKLRSSGSEISKLQEVGRGLRLPVNEYGNRVKDEQFYLNYFVDFKEADFVDDLVNEINKNSGTISPEQEVEKLTEEMVKKICELYERTEEDLLEELDEQQVINRTNKFKENGFAYIKANFPLIFGGVGSNKIRKAGKQKPKLRVRTKKYWELKELWERLNEKVILEYKFESEREIITLFTEFLKTQESKFRLEGLKSKTVKLELEEDQAYTKIEASSIYEDKIVPVVSMPYHKFLKALSKAVQLNIKTIHQAFIDAELDINAYLNNSTIRVLQQNFNNFLMYHAIDKYSIAYKKVSNSIHPTFFTDGNGNVLEEVEASYIGTQYVDKAVANNYFLEELYFDSELEKLNISSEIKEVIVFTKIPKNSIKIPVAGGKSYSPDFAYVLEYENDQKSLHFIVETKNVDGEEVLRAEEKQKIKHAEQLFGGAVKIKFRTQFSNKKMFDLIQEIVGEE
jgi:type III restriction enzyme